MFLLTDSTLIKTGGSTGFYVMAWLPLAVIVVFAVRLALKGKNRKVGQ